MNDKSKIKIYVVGGYVRDLLLGLKSNDIDYVVTGADVQTMLSYGFHEVGSSFPVFLNDLHQEFALARDDRDFSSDITIETDLYHRDFTINAMALLHGTNDLDKLIDPYGGKSDIENKIIRLVNPNAIKIDPIRAIRAARFAARFDFKIDSAIIDSVSEINSDDLCNERVWREFSKTINTDYFDKFINNLISIGMDVKLKFNRTSEFNCPSDLTPLQKYKAFTDSHDVSNIICKLPTRFVQFSQLYYDPSSSESIHNFMIKSKNFPEIYEYIDIFDPSNSVLLRSIHEDFNTFEIDMDLEGKERGEKLKSQRIDMINKYITLKYANNIDLSNEAFESLCKSIDSPSKPTKKLIELMRGN